MDLKNNPQPENDDNRMPPGSGIGAGIAIGAGFGVALGTAFDNLALGIAIGAALGVAIGAAIENRRKSLPDETSISQRRMMVITGIGLALLLVGIAIFLMLVR